ncbi:MAG: UDP-3-O-(3-hydroxymyristoyl)glucosamine N-acyltransferase [Desulfobacterales bacterium]|nr:UDP-3-O-(3-hydroxymyristoyl)glucosamine N-acyltransferase [Desulfobacterales bacterium]
MAYIGDQCGHRRPGDRLSRSLHRRSGSEIGNNTVLYPNVTVMNDCVIGEEVIIHAGTVIGSDGFGFVRDGPVNVKIPQMGTVQIDDHVEIGANNCIDRAALGKTWIKRGVKTDNLVQIAHNVVIGEDTILVAQAAIGGSVSVGNQVVIGGQAAIRDHLRVEDRAMIGSQSGVAKSLGQGEIVSGSPAIPHRVWLKTSGSDSAPARSGWPVSADWKKAGRIWSPLNRAGGLDLGL